MLKWIILALPCLAGPAAPAVRTITIGITYELCGGLCRDIELRARSDGFVTVRYPPTAGIEILGGRDVHYRATPEQFAALERVLGAMRARRASDSEACRHVVFEQEIRWDDGLEPSRRQDCVGYDDDRRDHDVYCAGLNAETAIGLDPFALPPLPTPVVGPVDICREARFSHSQG